ncbi:MAG: hypothetical protein Q7S47_00245 [bacterium]|nr:hypothetical protein [bacterium]
MNRKLISVLGMMIALLLGTGTSVDALKKPVVKAKAKAARVLSLAEKQLVGTYRCSSYNVSGGGGGNCRIAPPIVIKADGSYTMSSEKGTFKVANKKLTLSASKIRGVGAISSDSRTVTFSYTYNRWRHVVTYLRQGAVAEKKPTAAAVSTPPQTQVLPTHVQVDITVQYPKDTGSVSWINVIALVPAGSTPKTATYRPESLAIAQDDRTVHASFFGAKELETGRVYDIYTSSGLEEVNVGILDLREARGPVTKLISYSPLPITSPGTN